MRPFGGLYSDSSDGFSDAVDFTYQKMFVVVLRAFSVVAAFIPLEDLNGI